MSILIYGLSDPRYSTIRYVGQTAGTLNGRLKRHLRSIPPFDFSKMTKVKSWIQSLVKLGIKPEIFLIEVSTEDQWVEAETFWIAYFKFIGANLTNMTNGGDGVHGYKFSQESRMKAGEYHKGEKNYWYGIGPMTGKKHKPESILKMKRFQKGRKKPPSHAIKQSARRGEKRPEITKQRLKEAWTRKDRESIKISLSNAWKRKPRIWITDGIYSKQHFIDEPLPEGWSRGRPYPFKSSKERGEVI